MPLTKERLEYWKKICGPCCFDILDKCRYGDNLGNCAYAPTRKQEEIENEYKAIALRYAVIVVHCPVCDKDMEVTVTPDIIKNGIQLDDFTCNKIKFLSSNEIRRLLKEV